MYVHGNNYRYKSGAENIDIRDAMEDKLVLQTAVDQVRNFAPAFVGDTFNETFFNIWKYLKTTITYREDPKDQNIQLPARLIKTEVGDCKSLSLFTGAVLIALGYQPYYQYASYMLWNPIPNHVYVACNGKIIDVVYNSYNAEKKANWKYHKLIQL